MKSNPLALAACMVAFLLAGCADAPPGNETAEGETPGAELAGLPMPTWNVGDWWAYESPFATGTLVVAADTGSAWEIATDNQEWAYWHSDIEATSYMGEQRKSDLAGSQGADVVQFFDWPLVDGKSWATPWDGEQLTITATKVADTTFRMEGFAGDTLRVSYEYRSALGWFQWMSFFNDDGTEAYRLDIRDSGNNYDGELVRVDTTLIDSVSGEAGVQSTFYDPFNAAEGADLYLFYEGSCEDAAGASGAPMTFAIGPAENVPSAANEGFAANDDGFTVVDQCPYSEEFSGIIGHHPNEGNWGFLVEAPVGAQWSFELILREFERYTI